VLKLGAIVLRDNARGPHYPGRTAHLSAGPYLSPSPRDFDVLGLIKE